MDRTEDSVLTKPHFPPDAEIEPTFTESHLLSADTCKTCQSVRPQFPLVLVQRKKDNLLLQLATSCGKGLCCESKHFRHVDQPSGYHYLVT